MASRSEKAGTVVVLTALIVGGISVPAHAAAAPGSKITTVPDGGARPETTKVPLLPNGTLAIPATLAVDPLLALKAQVDTARVESGALAERINELERDLEAAKLTVAWAEHAWKLSDEKLKLAKAVAVEAATTAYLSKDQLPESLQNHGLLGDLRLLKPGGQPHGTGPAFDLEKAAAEEVEARQALQAADAVDKSIAAEVATVTATFIQRDNARLVLEQRLIRMESEEALKRDRELAQLQAGYNAGQSNAGLLAAPAARQAVMYALAQLGKPYKFAEEGPNFFDCSGLTQTAYRNNGHLLPRVANDQYFSTRHKTVRLDALLPGDLLFYARDPKDWKTIHHVMIYLGKENGVHKIVHAPRTGDVVKISAINLGSGTQVDFATRVFDGVPVPPPPPPVTPPTTPATPPAAPPSQTAATEVTPATPTGTSGQ